MMTVESIKDQIRKLSPPALAELRAWFAEFEWEAWDRQLERDVKAGKLDELGERVLVDHAAGKTRPL